MRPENGPSQNESSSAKGQDIKKVCLGGHTGEIFGPVFLLMLLPCLVVCEIEHLRTRHAFDLVTVYDVVQEGLVTPEDLVTLGARISVFLFSSLGLGNFLWLQARFAVFSQVSRFHVFNL